MTLEGRFVRLEPLSLPHLDRLCEIGLDEELWRWTVVQVSRGPRSMAGRSLLPASVPHLAGPCEMQ